MEEGGRPRGEIQPVIVSLLVRKRGDLQRSRNPGTAYCQRNGTLFSGTIDVFLSLGFLGLEK